MFSYVVEKQDAWGHVLTVDMYILQCHLIVEMMNGTHGTGTVVIYASWLWHFIWDLLMVVSTAFIDCDLSVNFLQ